MVAGHSLGGFLAQHFSKVHSMGGASFYAPALGNYDLGNENARKQMYERYVTFATTFPRNLV